MSVRYSAGQARSRDNAGIKFALTQPDGTADGPHSSSSKTFSEKSAGSVYAAGTREKANEDGNRLRRLSSHSQGSSARLANHSTQGHSARPPVRTIPAWVKCQDHDQLAPEPPSGYFLPNSPQSAFIAEHHHSSAKAPESTDYPEAFHTSSGLLSEHPYAERKSRWTSFATANAYPRECLQGEKMEPDWLNKHLTDYSKPWLADHDENDIEGGSGRYRAFRRKRKTWYKRTQQTILRNPMIPLVFRMTVFTFSTVALALGGVIHRQTEASQFPQGPSTLMAIIVDVIALIYIVYITYDEYTGKPLGLRSAKAKLRVLFLDLFFIVFQSANLSLAFQTLSDPDAACEAGTGDKPSAGTNDGICSKQKALASVLLIALIAWLNTFCVSILRLVERVVQR